MHEEFVLSDYWTLRDLISELIELCFGKQSRELSDRYGWPEYITGPAEPRPRGKLVRREGLTSSHGEWKEREARKKREQEAERAAKVVSSMRDQMNSNVLSALRRADLSAVVLADYGRCYHVPSDIWTSIKANHTPGALKMPVKLGSLEIEVEGRVLFSRIWAEAWLETVTKPTDKEDQTVDLASSYKGRRRSIPKATLERWLQSHVAHLKSKGEPRGELGLTPMWKAAQAAYPNFSVPKNRVDELRKKLRKGSVIPRSWDDPGAPPKNRNGN